MKEEFKKLKKRWKIIAVTIFMLIIIGIGYIEIRGILTKYQSVATEDNLLETVENMECKENNACKDCKVIISCINVVQNGTNDFFYLKVKNQNNVRGDCFLKLYFSENGTNISDKIYSMGILTSNETKAYRTEVLFPEAEIEFNLIPDCRWLN